MRVQVQHTDSATMSRVLLYLYTGYYDDDTALNLGKQPACEQHLSPAPEDDGADEGSTMTGSPTPTPNTASSKTTVEDSGTDKESLQIRRLLANAKVYGCAKQLEIDGLVTLAKQKFVFEAQNPFRAANFLEAAKIIFEKTKSGDAGLRADVVRTCVTHMASVKECSDLDQLLMKHEHLAWDLLGETKTNLLDEIEGKNLVAVQKTTESFKSENDKLIGDLLTAKNQSRELELRNKAIMAEAVKVKCSNNEVTRENNKLTARVKGLEAFIDRIERHINNVVKCRNCGQNFWVVLEVANDYNTFLTRCGMTNCGCKHRD